MTAPSIRARVRDELTAAIKAAARRQLATEGANLSLRAVARELGMVSSAVYRYFPSRDDLLTALIIDSYNELGEAGENALAALPEDASLLDRWLTFGHSMRDWALANPAEYALIYGSPVPGYKAPPDTIGPASRTTNLIISILVDGYQRGEWRSHDEELPEPLDAEIRAMLEEIGPGIPAGLMLRGMTAWIQLFGAVTFELFGRLNNVIEASRKEFFDYQMRVMAKHVWL